MINFIPFVTAPKFLITIKDHFITAVKDSIFQEFEIFCHQQTYLRHNAKLISQSTYF